MTNANPTALLRSLIVYAICVPLAVVLGFTLVNLPYYSFHDTQSMVIVGVVVGVLVFPLLMKWHYPLLLFSWNLPIVLFFLPGRPSLFIPMVVASLTISIIERILNRNRPFLPAGGVRWPLILLVGVIYLTAKLTGGFGLRAMGSDVYGGKKYLFLIVGIMSLFAITARPIPRNQVKLYVFLFIAGGFFSIISDLYAFIPGPLRGIYALFPPSGNAMDSMGNFQVEWGRTRLGGIAGTAGWIFTLMVAVYGFRGCFLTHKLWRPAVVIMMVLLITLGGFRSAIIGVMLTLGLLFFMEKIHRTSMMLVVVLLGISGAVLLVPLTPHLPYTFQRTLAFLPLDISPDVRMDAEDSTEWRLAIWSAIAPQIPKYLLLGKGYAFTQETFNESMGANAMFHNTIDPSQDPLALSSDFHSGPLSVVIPFGLWGVIIWMWYVAAGFRVVWRNYQYCDDEVKTINRFFYVYYITKLLMFFFIFGDFVNDVGGFGAVIGLSIAINHGVMKPKSKAASQPNAVKPGPYTPRLAWQRQ